MTARASRICSRLCIAQAPSSLATPSAFSVGGFHAWEEECNARGQHPPTRRKASPIVHGRGLFASFTFTDASQPCIDPNIIPNPPPLSPTPADRTVTSHRRRHRRSTIARPTYCRFPPFQCLPARSHKPMVLPDLTTLVASRANLPHSRGGSPRRAASAPASNQYNYRSSRNFEMSRRRSLKTLTLTLR